MGLFSRRRPVVTPLEAAGGWLVPLDPAAALARLARAQREHRRAEEYGDRSPDTRANLEQQFAQAAAALHAAGSDQEVHAWLGLADALRYQKRRRPDTLDAFHRALAPDPGSEPAWDAFLDYFTYAPTAHDLLGVLAMMPPYIRPGRIELLQAVAERRDTWGTMAPAEADAFQAALPAELRRLDDMPSLGLCLSRMGLRTERDGSREQALALLRDAVATGARRVPPGGKRPSPCCCEPSLQRLTAPAPARPRPSYGGRGTGALALRAASRRA